MALNLKNRTLADRITFYVAFAILGLALVLVPIGIFTHKEAGLMSVCWDSFGVADYTGCQGQTQLLKWPKSEFPLRVWTSTPDPNHSVENAVKNWNFQLRFKAFQITDDPSIADVSVSLNDDGAPVQNLEGGVTEHFLTPKMHARVRMKYIGSNYIEGRAVYHEFGHVLGLAHDDYPASPMYPITIDNTLAMDENGNSLDGMDFLVVSDSDKKILRGLYAP